MEETLKTIFTSRIDDIVMSQKFVYKQLNNYTSTKYRDNDLEKFAIMNGIWQEYLVRSVCKYDINFFETIPAIDRSKDIFKVNRDYKPKNPEKSAERNHCHWFCKNQQNKFPQIILYDREVPIKQTGANKRVGKIDLVGADNDEMVIIEYKIASSPEPLLRAVAEIVTYFYQIGGKNGAATYLEQFNKTFGLNCKKVGMAVAVPEIMYKAAHRYAFDLIQKYEIRCYSVDARSDDEPETIEIKRIDNEALRNYRKESENNMKFVYDHSDDIMQALKND